MKWLKVSQTDDAIYNILMALNDPSGAQEDAEALVGDWVDAKVFPVVDELDPGMGEGRVWDCVNTALGELFVPAVRAPGAGPVTNLEFLQALGRRFMGAGMSRQAVDETLRRIR